MSTPVETTCGESDWVTVGGFPQQRTHALVGKWLAGPWPDQLDRSHHPCNTAVFLATAPFMMFSHD